jgi:hypothetical protein
MTCLLYWLTSFRGEDLKKKIPIGSYVKTTVCLLKVAILDGGQGKQTWEEWSLGGQLSKLCPVTLTSIQDGNHQRT